MKMFRKKNDAGVSPVIATLVLVLVAVAAGVAFYAWQSNWQDDTTSNIGDGVVKTEIGGSSTVYPFTAVAAEAYMEANPTVQINYQSGGSGAGTAGVREGTIDIGCASSSRTQAKNFPDHPDVVIEKVGQDAVGVVVASGNTRVTDINATVATEIFDGTITTWGEVPMASGYTGTADVDVSDDTVISGDTLEDGYYRMWSADTLERALEITTDDQLPTGTFATGATIFWQPIADGTDTTEIGVFDRTDKSGTEECFNEKLLGRDGSSIPEDWATGVAGNQEMLDHFASGGANDIGFISTGVATSDVKVLTLNGVDASAENIADGSYVANRPLLYMYIPSQTSNLDIVEDYVQFCLQPRNNQDFAGAVDYLSWYDLE